MRQIPFVTEDLSRRIHHAGDGFMLEWLEGIRARPGNPRGLSIERFGDAIAPVCPAWPDVDHLNRVMGLGAADVERVPDIVAFYRSHDVRPWFEVIPGEGTNRLAAALAEAGAEELGPRSALCGAAALHDLDTKPAPDAPPPPVTSGVEIRRIGAGEMLLFSDLFVRGYELPEDIRDEVVADEAHWATVPGWRLYLATVERQPAAVAVLATSGGVGYLANSVTLPEWRGRGCQTALIRRRIADAEADGCDLVCALADVDSTSERNLERAGLRVASTYAVWRLRA